jgi:hypothetical protein
VGTTTRVRDLEAKRPAKGKESCVRLLDPTGNRVLRAFSAGPGDITSIAASQWRFVAAVVERPEGAEGPKCRVFVWDAQLGSELVHWDLDEPVAALEFVPSPQGGSPQFLLVAGQALRQLAIPHNSGSATE